MSSSMPWGRAVRQDPRWILLPLRAYLGFTFVYAGLSKLGGRSFLDSASPTSMHATLLAVKGQSPIGGLLGPVVHHSFAFGLLIALGETAVGIGVLLGLFTRVAALGGILIALSLFLTVSWNASPWYTGADIVYVFAFTPLLLGGAGPLSADEWLAAARARDRSPSAVVADRTRRTVLGGAAAVAGLIAVGIASAVRRSSPAPVAGAAVGNGAPAGRPSTAPGSPPASASPSGSGAGSASGPVLVAAGAVPVGGAAQATDPKTGDPVYVLQPQAGVYTALDRACPHQGCPVRFVSSSAGFACPCHGSTFDPSGTVITGPATTGLTKIPVARSGNNIVRT
jgi:thiosulfate dehydrogenase [quinone] large subunit